MGEMQNILEVRSGQALEIICIVYIIHICYIQTYTNIDTIYIGLHLTHPRQVIDGLQADKCEKSWGRSKKSKISRGQKTQNRSMCGAMQVKWMNSSEWFIYMLKLYFKIKILSNALEVISSTSLTSIKRRKKERASLHWPTTASKSTTTTAATKYLLLHLQHWPTKSRFAPLSLNLRSKTSPPWKNWATSSFATLFISSGQSLAIIFF